MMKKWSVLLITACVILLSRQNLIKVWGASLEQAAQSGYYEAELETIYGNLYVDNKQAGYTGTGYVDGFEGDDATLIFNVTVQEEGYYNLVFRTMALNNDQENQLFIDDNNEGTLYTRKTDDFNDTVYRYVYLTKGTHKIAVVLDWGWILVDALKLEKMECDPVSYSV